MSGGGEFVVSSSLLSHRHRLLDAVHVLIVETANQLHTMEGHSSSVAVKGKEGLWDRFFLLGGFLSFSYRRKLNSPSEEVAGRTLADREITWQEGGKKTLEE